jgi:hypothetical protein
VKCAGCKFKVPSKDYKQHTEVVCKTSCKYCRLVVLFKMMKDLEDFDCLEKTVKCSNDACKVKKIARKDLEDHKLNDCLFQPIKCPFFITGCGYDCDGFVLRKEFHTHITDNANTSYAIISSSKKTVELENKVLVLSSSPQSKIFVSKLLDLAKQLDPTEEILLKKWIEIYNKIDLDNKQPIENLFKNIIIDKKRKLNIENKTQITNTIIFEFEIPKNFTKNDVFNEFSHSKILHQEIQGYINFEYEMILKLLVYIFSLRISIKKLHALSLC